MENSFSFSTIVLVFSTFFVLVGLRLSIKIVPQSQNWLIESFGKYSRKLDAGLHLIIPFYESIQHKVSIQEKQMPPDPIHAITLDNVTITVTLALLYRVTDASRYVYRIENAELAIKTVVNGIVRNVIGRTELDGVQSNRRNVSNEIEQELKAASEEWGIVLTRVEIVEVDVDDATKDAMQKQLNAERMRRSHVTEAEGKKQATQLNADAELYAATKHAEAKKILADAEAYAVSAVSKAITDGGVSAVEFEIKKIQANAVQELAKGSNAKIVLLPTDVLNGLSGTLGRLASKL
jgi:regulator of protease activity HflC (stomatin/prohibitin superfamily)